MKNVPFLLLSFFLLIAGSCTKPESNDGLKIDEVIQIIFFTDESQYEYEAPYYAAIIELKMKFPDEFKHMLVLTPETAEKYERKFGIKDYPAILVVHKGKSIVKIQGAYTRNEIIEPVSAALSNLSNLES